jgi:hypothetical protein
METGGLSLIWCTSTQQIKKRQFQDKEENPGRDAGRDFFR